MAQRDDKSRQQPVMPGDLFLGTLTTIDYRDYRSPTYGEPMLEWVLGKVTRARDGLMLRIVRHPDMNQGRRKSKEAPVFKPACWIVPGRLISFNVIMSRKLPRNCQAWQHKDWRDYLREFMLVPPGDCTTNEFNRRRKRFGWIDE